MNTTQRLVLVFEAQWNRRYGDKDTAIRTELGLSPTRYDAILEDLLDLPEALTIAPGTITRHRRLRDARQLHHARGPTPPPALISAGQRRTRSDGGERS